MNLLRLLTTRLAFVLLSACLGSADTLHFSAAPLAALRTQASGAQLQEISPVRGAARHCVDCVASNQADLPIGVALGSKLEPGQATFLRVKPSSANWIGPLACCPRGVSPMRRWAARLSVADPARLSLVTQHVRLQT